MKKIISSRLESLRKDMTQKEFAKTIGVPLTTYTNWILGLRVPNADYIIAICSKLGVSADWLLGLSEIPHPAGKIEKPKLSLFGSSQQALADTVLKQAEIIDRQNLQLVKKDDLIAKLQAEKRTKSTVPTPNRHTSTTM